VTKEFQIFEMVRNFKRESFLDESDSSEEN
jgi:hypothetical protein